MPSEELTYRTELRTGGSGPLARAETIADGAAPGRVLSTPDGHGILWVPQGTGPSSGLQAIRVPFDANTGVAIIGSVVAGQIIVIAQLTIEILFGPGSQVSFGTVATPSLFVTCPGDLNGSVQNPQIDTITVNDFLLLTVFATSSVGSGYLTYTVQS